MKGVMTTSILICFVLVLSVGFVSAVWPFTGNAVGDVYEMDSPTDWKDSDVNPDNPDGINENVGGILTSARIPYRLDHSDQCSSDGESVEERYLRFFQRVECKGFFCFLGGGTRTTVDKVKIRKVTKFCEYGCVEVERDFSDISALVGGLKMVGECGSPSVDICDGNILDSGDNNGNDPAVPGIAVLNRGSGDSYEIEHDEKISDEFIKEWYCDAEGELDYVEVECAGEIREESITVTPDLIPNDNKQLDRYAVAYCFQYAPTCNVLTADEGGVSGTGILGPTDVVTVSTHVDGRGIGTREPVSACVSSSGRIGVNSGPGYITYGCNLDDEVTPNPVVDCLNGCRVVEGVAGCVGTTCNDPDGERSGRNSVKRGVTTGGNFQATDVCIQSNKGIEFYCGSATEDFIRYRTFTCSGSTPHCNGGKCSAEEIIEDEDEVEYNLVAHYEFEDNVLDSAGEHDGTLYGVGIDFLEGRIGKAISLNGESGNYVDIQLSEDLQISGAMTVSAWVYNEKTNAERTGWGLPISTYTWRNAGEKGNHRGWTFGDDYGTADEFYFRVWDGNKKSATASKKNVFAQFEGEWVHVVGVFNPGAHVRLYINGEMVASDATDVPAEIVYGEPLRTLRIGARADGENQGKWKGRIDDVRIYDYALSAEEITFITLSTNIL